ncbi:hypothetical protein [Paenibacillus sp. SI8]|uniref:hypothetical protein n=1 Tax=unclassified Paenibacillus TaxID=185978 RepID=UPI0034653E18
MNITYKLEIDPELIYPMQSYMRIREIGNREIGSKWTKIIISELSDAGLRFKSNLILPNNENIVWDFQMGGGLTVVNAEFTIGNSKSLNNGYEYEGTWKVKEGSKQQLFDWVSLLLKNQRMSERMLGTYNRLHHRLVHKNQVDLLC